MAGPGGDEVGRVSIRVVPDTDGFRDRLRAAVEGAEQGLEVTIPVNFDVDTAGLRSQLEALELSKITIPVDLNLDTASFRTQLEAIENSRVVIPVELDLRDTQRLNAMLARLNNRSVKINVRLNGINQAIAKLTALDAIIRRLNGRKIEIDVDIDAGAAIVQIAAIEAALSGLRGSIGSIGTSGGQSFSRMGHSAALAAGALVLIPPLAAAIAVAGAAITAAWGGISTMIAAIPAALFLAAAPMGAIMLGLDGLKNAAKTIKPEFDKMKEAISGTFERGMIPVFKQLATIFPTLTTGMQGTATAVTGIAQRLVEMIASEAGIARLDAIFRNVNSTLTAMAPGIAAAVDGLLIMGSQTEAFAALADVVHTFGTEFRASVLDLLSDGTLQTAMVGLQGSLRALTNGFVQLVDNGIRVFAAAAPGVNQFFNSITGFFERFNWESLGASVGGVFSGLAAAINAVPTATIRDIEVAFADLSAVFQSAEFQGAITDLIGAIPEAISLISDFTKEFATIAEGVSGAITAISDLSGAFSDFAASVQSSAENLGKQLGLQGPGSIGEWMANLDDEIDRQYGIIPPNAEQLGQDIGEGGARGLRGGGGTFGQAAGEVAGEVPPALSQGLAPAADAVTQGMTPAAAALTAALAQMPPLVQEQLGQMGASVGVGMAAITQGIANGSTQWVVAIMSGMTAMQSTVTAGVAGMATAMNTAMTMVQAATVAGMDQATLAIATGTANWVVAIMTGMTAVTDTIAAQSLNWTTAITTAMTALNTTIDAGFAMLAAGATVGMDQVTLAIAAASANWVVAIMTAMDALKLTFDAGFLTLAAGATVGMEAVTLAIATGTANWVVAIMTGMEALNLTIDAGFVGMAAAATAGMLVVQEAITAGATGWSNAIGVGMQGVQLTLGQAFSQLATIAREGMNQIQVAIRAGFTFSHSAVTSGMTQMQDAVRNGMTQMTTAVRTGMQQIQNAIQTGMNASTAAVRAGVSQMLGVLRSAVGQFRAAGANMGQALADGLNSKVGAVQAAANRLAQAAAAATRAAAGIRSPSRVFIGLGEQMGAGLEIGLRVSRSGVEREAEKLTNAVISNVSRIESAFPDDPWAADLNARMNTELAQLDEPGAAAAPQTVIQTTINNPLPEKGSDSVAQVHRRQAAMGIFG